MTKAKKSGIIPSQNALRFCASMLRRNQHTAIMEAILHSRCGISNEPLRKCAMEQSHDYGQVAQFLEERLIK